MYLYKKILKKQHNPPLIVQIFENRKQNENKQYLDVIGESKAFQEVSSVSHARTTLSLDQLANVNK